MTDAPKINEDHPCVNANQESAIPSHWNRAGGPIPDGFEVVEWAVIRFIPNLVIGEYLNIGLAIYRQGCNAQLMFGDYAERIRGDQSSDWSARAIEDEVREFRKAVEENGKNAETERIFQDVNLAIVRVGDQKWGQRLVAEIVP
jgi:hypothetical protein